MWWFFVREFYRLGTPPAQMQAAALQHPIQAFSPPAAEVPAAPEPSSIPPLLPYLQRLGAEGASAFGLWDSGSGFSMFSANWSQISGVPSDVCAGHGWIVTLDTPYQYAVNEALHLAETEGRASSHLVRMRGNEAEDWRYSVLDIKPPSARQPYVMLMLRDVTNEKNLEAALRESEGALQLANRGRSSFLSSMSHELRTPLNAIMGFSQMMRDGVLGDVEHPTYKEYVEHIHDSGAHLLAKINDLLDIASMDAGGLRLEESRFGLAELLHEACEMHSHDAFAAQCHLRVDCPFDTPLTADRRMLLSALSHLVTNAVRHAQATGTITISARMQGKDGLVIAVRDSGKGIGEEQLAAIREALRSDATYFQVDGNGIGLGLSLCKELLSRHQGRLMIDSMRGHGTCTSMFLPAERIHSDVKKRVGK